MVAALLAIAFARLWTHAENGWMLGIPTIAHGIVYEGTTRGDVLALDEHDGRLLWRASLGANPDETYGNPRGVISAIVVNGTTAYVISGSCEAAAFDAQTGRLRWRRRVCSPARNDDTYASPAVGDGRVLLSIDVIADRPTDTGHEVALEAATGAPLWSFSPVRYRGTGGGISATPAIDERRGLAFVGTGNPTPMSAPPLGADPYTDSIVAVDVRNGRWRWVRQLLAHDANDFDVFASPQLYRIRLHGRSIDAVGDTLKSSRYFMLDESSGKILWQRQLEPVMKWMQSIGTPVSSGNTIVVPLFHAPASGALIALRKNDGVVIWRSMTQGIYGAPVIWRGVVLAAEVNGSVEAFDLRDGRPLGRLSIASKLYGRGLALDGDALFVGGRGAFWAYRLKE